MADKHLSELCQGNDIDAIYSLVKQHAETSTLEEYPGGVWGYQDDDGRTAFHWAIALRNFDLANTLANAPNNAPVLTLDEDRATPLITLCSVGCSDEFVDDLLARCVAAFDEKFVDYCQRLDTSGLSSWNACEGKPVPVPFCAEAFSSVVSVEDKRARILNWCDSLGNTALLNAVSRGHKQLVGHLLQLGADINAQNNRGQTALHRAVGRGHMDLVEMLVKFSEAQTAGKRALHRRWMDTQDYRGDTALFYASMENNEELGRYLLQHGADRDMRNKAGKQFWEV